MVTTRKGITMYESDLTDNGVPSKRQVRNRSGRAGRKGHNGAQWVARSGGYNNWVKAALAPADALLCHVAQYEVKGVDVGPGSASSAHAHGVQTRTA